MRSASPMLPRTVLAIALCVALGVPATAAANARNLDGFKTVLPRAFVLCAKADSGKLAAKLAPSRHEVRAACGTLRQSYSAARIARTAKVAPLQTRAYRIVGSQRTTCRKARRTQAAAARKVACAAAADRARARLAPPAPSPDKPNRAISCCSLALPPSLDDRSGKTHRP